MQSVLVPRRGAGRVARGISWGGWPAVVLALVLAQSAPARAEEAVAPAAAVAAPGPAEKPADRAATGETTPAPTAPTAPAAPSPQTDAVSDGSPTDNLLAVDVHGFVSQGFILSTGNNYLAQSKRGSFEFNEVGINVSKQLGDRLRVGMQLFARDLGPVGNYVPRFDWFNLDYRFADWLGVRAGRLKTPFGLYNEINDVDSARVPVLLPQSVYPILNRDILLAQTGGEIYGYVPMRRVGALEYRLYGGTLYIDPPAAAPPLTLKKFDVPYVFGGRLMYEAPIEGLRAGGSVQALRFDTTYTLPGMPGMPPPELTVGIPFLLWLGSIEYAAHDLLLAAEYGRWTADVETTIGTVSKSESNTNERYYVMGAYRVTPWFYPGMYYSHYIVNIDKPNTRDNFQDDLALTVRFDLTAHWLLKLEGHYMHGTADVQPELNDGVPKKDLTLNWGAFFVKTTAYF